MIVDVAHGDLRVGGNILSGTDELDVSDARGNSVPQARVMDEGRVWKDSAAVMKGLVKDLVSILPWRRVSARGAKTTYGSPMG
jgi:hypothetical protein